MGAMEAAMNVQLGAMQAAMNVQLGAMQAAMNAQFAVITGRLDEIRNESLCNRNASASQPEHALVIPRNAANQPLPAGMWVPQTRRTLLTMDDAQADALLAYYTPNALVPPLIDDRIDLIASHLGVRLQH